MWRKLYDTFQDYNVHNELKEYTSGWELFLCESLKAFLTCVSKIFACLLQSVQNISLQPS